MSPAMTKSLAQDCQNDPIRKKALDKMIKDTPLNHLPQPLQCVNIDWGGAGVGHKECTQDGVVAYQSAVLFWCTKDIRYADLALRILHAWAMINKSFVGNNAVLELSWCIGSMARAAELMKYAPIGDKWMKMEAMFYDWIDKVVWPVLRDPVIWRWKQRNNWHFSNIDTRLQLAILREDHAEFAWCIKTYKEIYKCAVGTGHPCHTCETTRDVTHCQFLLGGLIQIPEMLWHQGIKDIFAPELVHVFEYQAAIMLKEVPDGIKKEDIRTPYGYWYEPVWEIPYHHFHGRKKIPMPKTEKWLATFRPERVCFQWGGGTLTHYNRDG